MSRKGRVKPNVAGERYDSNAIPLDLPRNNTGRTRPFPTGMPADMQQMMEQMMQGGGIPGMGGMGGLSGMMGEVPGTTGMPPGATGMPVIPKAFYRGLPEGADISKLVTFYPAHINSKKTLQEGRRIPKEQACEDPIVDEMSEVCEYFKLPHAVEPAKKYVRDWKTPGRIRVRLIREDGTFEHAEIQSRKQLMLKMAELIPRLQSRKERLEKEEANKAAIGSNPSGAGASTSSSNKKKGKKKGRR